MAEVFRKMAVNVFADLRFTSVGVEDDGVLREGECREEEQGQK
jgi:hypothetical protein